MVKYLGWVYGLVFTVFLFHPGQGHAQSSRPMPSFSFTELNGKNFSNKNIKKSPGLIIYFDPLCDICRHEMKLMEQHQADLNEKQVILVSPGKPDDIQQFAKEFNIENRPNFTLLLDKKDTFYRLFDAKSYPSIYVFDKNRKITSTFIGQTEIKELLKAFHDHEGNTETH